MGKEDKKKDTPKKKGKKKAKKKSESEEEEEEDEGADYVVEAVLERKVVTGKRGKSHKTLYLVKWLGWDREEDLTWEPLEHLKDPDGTCQAMEIFEKGEGEREGCQGEGGEGREGSTDKYRRGRRVRSNLPFIITGSTATRRRLLVSTKDFQRWRYFSQAIVAAVKTTDVLGDAQC